MVKRKWVPLEYLRIYLYYKPNKYVYNLQILLMVRF